MKGLAAVFQYIIVGFVVTVFIMLMLGIVAGHMLDVRDALSEDEQISRTINLAQVLLSSDELCYSDDDHIYRGVFDRSKLDRVESNPNTLSSRVHYPSPSDFEHYLYFLKIENIDESSDNIGDTWKIRSGSSTGMTKEFSVVRNFPVAIRYSENEIDVGMMEVEFGGYEYSLG